MQSLGCCAVLRESLMEQGTPPRCTLRPAPVFTLTHSPNPSPHPYSHPLPPHPNPPPASPAAARCRRKSTGWRPRSPPPRQRSTPTPRRRGGRAATTAPPRVRARTHRALVAQQHHGLEDALLFWCEVAMGAAVCVFGGGRRRGSGARREALTVCPPAPPRHACAPQAPSAVAQEGEEPVPSMARPRTQDPRRLTLAARCGCGEPPT